MLRSLLVGVNGSQWSDAACDIAVTWAASLKIPVTFLGIVDAAALAPAEATPIGAGPYKATRDASLITRGREQMHKALQGACQRAGQSQVECHSVQRDGSPSILLGEEAQRHDLIILGRRAIPTTDRDPPASETLMEIIRHSPRPIIVACKSIPKSSDVVIAYDGSVQAARTLQSFVSSGLYYGHPLHLVGIGESNAMPDILGRAADFLQAHSLKAETHVLSVDHSVAETLTDFLHRVPAGLMVMGAYGKPWYHDLLFGSVTRTVLAHVPVPLFLNH